MKHKHRRTGSPRAAAFYSAIVTLPQQLDQRTAYQCDLTDADTGRPLGCVAMGRDRSGRGAVIIALNDGKMRNLTLASADTIPNALFKAREQLDEILAPDCPGCQRLRDAVACAVDEMSRQRPGLLA